ncbi:unnamed protein product [Ceutorhynchus assimilis]|uniref:Uncharacterized protein n=1 Tax=Ceutorhynchus assimilis TaxID=467358 RepID=A0A9N9MZB7_9CUCU|nr:unnamed protein product [Ceutorhynchus assimilis]
MDKDLEAEISSAIAQLDKLSIKSSESGLSEDTCWEIFGGPCPESLKKKKKTLEEYASWVIVEAEPEVNNNTTDNNKKRESASENQQTPNTLEKSSDDNNREKIEELHETVLKNHKKINASKAHHKIFNPDTRSESKELLRPKLAASSGFEHKIDTFIQKTPSSEEKVIGIVNYESENAQKFSTVGTQQDFTSSKGGQTEPSDKQNDVGTMTVIDDKKLGTDKSIQTSDRPLGRSSTSSSARSCFSTTSSTFDETDSSATDSLEEINKPCYRCRQTNKSFECMKKPCSFHYRNLVKELKRKLEFKDSKKKFKISNFQGNNNSDDTKCNKRLQTSPINLQEGFRNPYKVNNEFSFCHSKNLPVAKDSNYAIIINAKKKKIVNNACQYYEPRCQKSSESDADCDKFWKKTLTNKPTLCETLKTTLEKRNRVKQVVDKFEEQKADFVSLCLPCMSHFPSKKVPKICTCCGKGKT